MKKLSLALITSLLVTGPSFAADEGTHWGYTGHESPEKWGELSPNYALCSSGKNQSPIDVVDTISGELPALNLDYKAVKAEIVNNGHTIQVNFKDDANKLSLNGNTFTLKQFHFHTPSENRIQGKSFPLEVHFVHADSNNNLAVLGLLYEVGAENAQLSPVWAAMPKEAGQPIALKAQINPAEMLPEALDYYRFNGSLTIPPCSEGVNWLLLKNTVSASEAQVKAIEAIMGNNSRPPQAVNARVILE